MKNNPTIKACVMDSGVGGFPILDRLVSEGFFAEVIYLADQKYFPYGEKSAKWLQDRLLTIAGWVKEQSVDIFVIACNTATVNAINNVRKTYDFEVVGIEPVVKPLSNYGSSLLLATSATLQSDKLLDMVSNHPSEGSLTTYTPSGLVGMIEDMNEEGISRVAAHLTDLAAEKGVEAVGLSCTHYPLILNELSRAMPDVIFIDPNEAVVKRIKDLMKPKGRVRTKVRWYTTGSIVRLKKQIAYYLRRNDSYNGSNLQVNQLDL